MSPRQAQMADGLLHGGRDVPFAEIEVTLARISATGASASAVRRGPSPRR